MMADADEVRLTQIDTQYVHPIGTVVQLTWSNAKTGLEFYTEETPPEHLLDARLKYLGNMLGGILPSTVTVQSEPISVAHTALAELVSGAEGMMIKAPGHIELHSRGVLFATIAVDPSSDEWAAFCRATGTPL